MPTFEARKQTRNTGPPEPFRTFPTRQSLFPQQNPSIWDRRAVVVSSVLFKETFLFSFLYLVYLSIPGVFRTSSQIDHFFVISGIDRSVSRATSIGMSSASFRGCSHVLGALFFWLVVCGHAWFRYLTWFLFSGGFGVF